MIEVINAIKQELTENGAENIYSAFDAIPIISKGRFFTVIGMKNFECSTPVYSQYTIYMPFKAEIEIKIHAPESSTMQELCEYYENNIDGVISGISGLSSRVSGMSVKQDKNINRLVLTVTFSAGGMKKTDREVTA